MTSDGDCQWSGNRFGGGICEAPEVLVQYISGNLYIGLDAHVFWGAQTPQVGLSGGPDRICPDEPFVPDNGSAEGEGTTLCSGGLSCTRSLTISNVVVSAPP